MANKKKKNDLTIHIGKQIASIRKKQGLSQQAVEDKTSIISNDDSIKYRTLSLIEQGYGEPKITTLNKIASALNVSLIELFDIEENVSINQPDKLLKEAHTLLKKLDTETLKLIIKLLYLLKK